MPFLALKMPVMRRITENGNADSEIHYRGKGLAMEDLGSSLRGLGLWAQRWQFNQKGGVSGIWTVEQLTTGKRCDLMITKDHSE